MEDDQCREQKIHSLAKPIAIDALTIYGFASYLGSIKIQSVWSVQRKNKPLKMNSRDKVKTQEILRVVGTFLSWKKSKLSLDINTECDTMRITNGGTMNTDHTQMNTPKSAEKLRAFISNASLQILSKTRQNSLKI